MMDILLIVAGFALLTLGGEWLVKACVVIAKKMQLSTFLVSAVVIGFGTSIPDLLVSVEAALEGSPDIAIGNVVGSNIFHILFVFGVAAAITPISCRAPQIRRDVLISVVATALLAGLSFSGEINRLTGLLLLAALVAYVASGIWLEKRKNAREAAADQELHKRTEEVTGDEKISPANTVFLVISGLGFLMAGAWLLVTGAVSLAHHFGISEAVIGLTLVALGTSFPELAAALVAAHRRRPDAVMGNLLGSNIFNILGILGITALTKPIPFTGQIARQDVWVMLATAVLLVPVALSGRIISRLEGFALSILYMGYVFWLYAG